MEFEYPSSFESCEKLLTEENAYGPLRICLGELSVKIEDAGNLGEAISKCQRLHSFILIRSEIQPKALELLLNGADKCKNLAYLDFTSSRIGDAGAAVVAAFLKSNKSVTVLNLRDNEIGDNGVESLAASLGHNRILRKLYLEDNVFMDSQKMIQALVDNLDNNYTLVTLGLGKNISNRIMKRLQATKALKEQYFAKQLDQPTYVSKFNHVKICMLGDRRSGKTTTLNSLISGKPPSAGRSIKKSKVSGFFQDDLKHEPTVFIRSVATHRSIGYWEDVSQDTENWLRMPDHVSQHVLRTLCKVLDKKINDVLGNSLTSKNSNKSILSNSSKNLLSRTLTRSKDRGLKKKTIKLGMGKNFSQKSDGRKKSFGQDSVASSSRKEDLDNIDNTNGLAKFLKKTRSVGSHMTESTANTSNSDETYKTGIYSNTKTNSFASFPSNLSNASRLSPRSNHTFEVVDLDSLENVDKNDIIADVVNKQKKRSEESAEHDHNEKRYSSVSLEREFGGKFESKLESLVGYVKEIEVEMFDLDNLVHPDSAILYQELMREFKSREDLSKMDLTDSKNIAMAKKRLVIRNSKLDHDFDDVLLNMSNDKRKKERLRRSSESGDDDDEFDAMDILQQMPNFKNLSNPRDTVNSNMSSPSGFSNNQRNNSLYSAKSSHISGTSGVSFGVRKYKPQKAEENAELRKRKTRMKDLQCPVELRRYFNIKDYHLIRDNLDLFHMHFYETSGDHYYLNLVNSVMAKDSLGLNLIVFDPSKFLTHEEIAQKKLLFYLSVLKARAPDAPCILVASKLDKLKGLEETLKVNTLVKACMDKIKKKGVIPDRKSKLYFFAVDNYKMFGVSELRQTIEDLARKCKPKSDVTLKHWAFLDMILCDKEARTKLAEPEKKIEKGFPLINISMEQILYLGSKIDLQKSEVDKILSVFENSGLIFRPTQDMVVTSPQVFFNASFSCFNKDLILDTAKFMYDDVVDGYKREKLHDIDKKAVISDFALRKVLLEKEIANKNDIHSVILEFLRSTHMMVDWKLSKVLPPDTALFLIPTLLNSAAGTKPDGYQIIFDFREKFFPHCFYFLWLECMVQFFGRLSRYDTTIQCYRNRMVVEAQDLFAFFVAPDVHGIKMVIEKNYRIGAFVSYILVEAMIERVNEMLNFGLRYKTLLIKNRKAQILEKLLKDNTKRQSKYDRLGKIFDEFVEYNTAKIRGINDLESHLRSNTL